MAQNNENKAAAAEKTQVAEQQAEQTKKAPAKGLKKVKGDTCAVIFWEKGQNFNPNTGEVQVKNRHMRRMPTVEAEMFIHNMNVMGFDCAVEE